MPSRFMTSRRASEPIEEPIARCAPSGDQIGSQAPGTLVKTVAARSHRPARSSRARAAVPKEPENAMDRLSGDQAA